MGDKDGSKSASMTEREWAEQNASDDALMKSFLDPEGDGGSFLNLDADVEIDQAGKADDAEDFGDISDDDLPDEEEPTTGSHDTLVDDSAPADNLLDDMDLWGEDGDGQAEEPTQADGDTILRSPNEADASLSATRVEDEGMNNLFGDEGDDQLEFADDNEFAPDANQDMTIPPPIENERELVKYMFPDLEKGTVLDFSDLMAPRPFVWKRKVPPKPPKPLVPTKLSLELAIDQEKAFRIPGTAQTTIQQKIQNAETIGYVSLLEPEVVQQEDRNIWKPNTEEDDAVVVNGLTLADIALICEDWDDVIDPPTPPAPVEPAVIIADGEDDEDWLHEQQAPKRRKIVVESGLPAITRLEAPCFDDFLGATKRAAKRVFLDFNDPHLLFEGVEAERQTKRPRIKPRQQRMANGKLGRDISQRFNIANDAAYEQLKEHRQSSVRSQLSNVQVEHSVPATKLVWPYYSIKPHGAEPHDYHRPQLKYSRGINVSVKLLPTTRVPKKEWKSKSVQQMFKSTKDLSLNDNSTSVLFEYCEEIPTVLSNFGMGNRVINYYRRKDRDDEERPPKPEIGDYSFLLPEDKSPFSHFGTIAPGETVPTLSNPMFHAPIFSQQPRDTDFLFGRSTTGQGGATYYLRKLDHLFVVGQNFPLVEVPGPHSRKVTTLTKNRMKMIAYRLIHANGFVTLQDITAHVRDSNDAQNRQKLKEFLTYDKDHKVWNLSPTETLMDKAIINTMIKPEEVCNLEAMQVGQNEITQHGYLVDDNMAADDEADETNKESFANQMAPWKTTKNFIEACSGKAMLALKGDGDPTGCGLGFSFIKTSMKGGFMANNQGPAATSADAMERERKANGGHLYNVKKQDELYKEAITKIWRDQRASLEDRTQHDDDDIQPQEDEDERFNNNHVPDTPIRFDESASQFSRPSTHIQEKRKLRIKRKYEKPDGEVYYKTEIVTDPGVISQYIKARARIDMAGMEVLNFAPTGDFEKDRAMVQMIEEEAARLARNKERREAREQQKARITKALGGDPDSPAPSVEKGGTSRKCANCGQKGHIKTNKKLCPMLNGTWKADASVEDGAFGVLKSGD